MSADGPDHDDPDVHLAGLQRAKNEAITRCHHRTAYRLATELKRAAKTARRLEPYVWALHTLMNYAPVLLEPETGREAAIELIAVLESEDRARQIQPDIDSADYERLVSRVSSCAYDGLGRSTALARGYNSEGVHDTVAEGIQVCRRTGKLECIACFREYASDVFLASDDMEMALHHARHVATHGNMSEGFDRRWSGASEEAKLLIIAGRLDAAEAATRRAWELIGSYHNPTDARLKTALIQEALDLLTEPEDGPQGDATARPTENAPPADEYPDYHLHRDLNSALRSSLRNDPSAAIQALTTWDRRLSDRQCLDRWFEVRLRLIAAYRLAGDEGRVSGLARQLEAKARESRDWLTLRRLSRLLDPGIPDSPIAPAGPIILATSVASPSEPETPEDGPEAGQVEASAPTPLGEALDSLTTRLVQASDDPTVKGTILDTLLGFGPDVATEPADVARMLHLARVLDDDPLIAMTVWDWAEAVAAPFPRDAAVLNTLAALGDSLRNAENSLVADRIDPQRIEHLFRQSLDLDPNNPGNYGRAAVHHGNAGRLNETERCLSRLLRLDRSNARASLWLAQIYIGSDRSLDALAVLDMALRAGSDDSDVAWQAATLAHSFGQNEALLTYLDQFESVRPGRPWTNYYRASGLLRLGRNEEANAALDEEERRSGENLLHVLILRACAASALGRLEDLRRSLAEILEVRLSGVEYLTHNGLLSLFDRLWIAAKVLPDDDPLLGALVDRLVVTGLAPNSLFEPFRLANPKAEGLSFYVCTITQPLDDRWRDSPGCLAHEGDWTGYRIPWGVLAADTAEASRVALTWQARGNPREATVDDVALQEDGYTDHPGVIWQGLRLTSD